MSKIYAKMITGLAAPILQPFELLGRSTDPRVNINHPESSVGLTSQRHNFQLSDNNRWNEGSSSQNA